MGVAGCSALRDFRSALVAKESQLGVLRLRLTRVVDVVRCTRGVRLVKANARQVVFGDANPRLSDASVTSCLERSLNGQGFFFSYIRDLYFTVSFFTRVSFP